METKNDIFRFLKFPGGGHLSSFSGSSNNVEFGVETGDFGAFRWFADFPVGTSISF